MRRPRDYFDLLDLIHQTTVPRTYVEIGVASGKSLSIALPGTILVGIDPAADVRHPLSGELHLFRQTSDDFFASGALDNVTRGLPIDVSFIDGLHHFDVVLRDFRNLEAASAPGSVILIHDCLPPTPRVAARERETSLWAGDVWKAIIGLREYRPDLSIALEDVPPTGLAVVTALKPTSRVLFDRYDEICAALFPRELPTSSADRRRLLGVVGFDWAALRNDLPQHPFRHEPVDHLVDQRRRRKPSWADVTWNLRRTLRYSLVGRILRPEKSAEAQTR
ncbi:MAG TPA: class I SAM-dependent methyltransferase [Edaphobacter sp.]